MKFYNRFIEFAENIKNQTIQSDIENNEISYVLNNAYHYNKWYSPSEVRRRILAIANFILSKNFKEQYTIFPQSNNSLSVGIYSDESIPAQEFFTLLSILLIGHSIQYKQKDKKEIVLEYLLKKLCQYIPDFYHKIKFTNELIDVSDAIIYAGRKQLPENTKYVFKKYKFLEITRHQSIGIIDNKYTDNDFEKLAKDVFTYYGKGPGNIKKLFVPTNYNIINILKYLNSWQEVINHAPYANNYEYYKSVYLVNKIEHFDNGFLLIKKEKQMNIPVGVLYYEEYSNIKELYEKIKQENNVEKIIVREVINSENETPLGQSEEQLFKPSLQLIDFLIK